MYHLNAPAVVVNQETPAEIIFLASDPPRHEEISKIRDEAGNKDKEITSNDLEHPVVTKWKERAAFTKDQPQAHHYNWYGKPVFHPTKTSPEESLAIILTAPKVPTGSSKVRVKSILNRAVNFLDPVVVDIKDLDNIIWELSGSDLAQAVEGRVRRLYSPHGRWMDEENEDGSILTDPSDTGLWNPSKYIIANGMVDNEPVPTWNNFYTWQWQLESQKPRVRIPKHLEWKPAKSPLSRMVS